MVPLLVKGANKNKTQTLKSKGFIIGFNIILIGSIINVGVNNSHPNVFHVIIEKTSQSRLANSL